MKDLMMKYVKKIRKEDLLLKTGREFSYSCIFDRLILGGVKETDMEETLRAILNEPIIAYGFLVKNNINATDIRELMRLRDAKLRKKSQEIKFEVDGVSSDDEHFYDVLLSKGECLVLK